MTLLELTQEIERVALSSPLVGYASTESHIEVLNDVTVANYPAVVIVPDGTHTVKRDTITFHVTVFYIDRLTEDLRNSAQVFSAGVQVLTELFRKLEESAGIVKVSDTIEMQNFLDDRRERMADTCGGTWAAAEITVNNIEWC